MVTEITTKLYKLHIVVKTKKFPAKLSELLADIRQLRPDVEFSYARLDSICPITPERLRHLGVPLPTAHYEVKGERDTRTSEFGTEAVYALLEDIKVRKV